MTNEDAEIRASFDLGHKFVDMIKSGSVTISEREKIRDALLDGVLKHPIVRAIVASADYSVTMH